ncbi:MAG: hypothetical protein U0930_25970 [Pirellulales bacterium]
MQNYFRWLSRPAMRGEPTQLPTAPVKTCLDSLINPLRSDADRITSERPKRPAFGWEPSVNTYRSTQSHARNGKPTSSDRRKFAALPRSPPVDLQEGLRNPIPSVNTCAAWA